MNNRIGQRNAARSLLSLAVEALALLAILACGDSTEQPSPSPTPQSMLFATPPSATSTGADDQPDPGIVVQLDSTPTPYPTATAYPTATPYATVPPAPTVPPAAAERTESTPAATPSPAPVLGPTIQIAIPKKSEVKHPKADSTLNGLIDRVEAGEITAEEAAKEAPLHRGESVGVTILLSGNVEGVVAFLEANGASNINAGEDYIEAYVPILLLGQTAEQQGVLRVDQIQPPGETQETSRVVGNGPSVHGSIAWNEAGYSGQGIKVGVIDSGFSGLQEILGTEVPAAVRARCYTFLGEHTGNLADCGGGTHGTVVSESVMDIAPDATLYISDPRSRSELKDAVDWMISEGVSVINHSRVWSFDGPGDGTSPLSVSPLNAIDRAVAAGIVWVNAAGNQARGTWFKRGPFDYTTENVDGEDIRFLRFSGSEIRNRDSYIGGRLELRWDDDWGEADTDLDLFALAAGTDTIALQSIDFQSGRAGHNPYEWFGSLATFDILVAHRSGPEPDWIQLVGWGSTRLTLNSSGAGSIINPAESANPGMLAVGAAPWYDVSVLSGFSSRGPTPDGRIKPEVVATNCGETATRGQGFCGTSQASPHVAGMAALVRQRFPNYTPAQVVSYLKENAEQRISSPDPNNNWGHGFFVLPAVSQPEQPTPTVPGAASITSVGPGTNSLTVVWRAPLQTGGATIASYDLRHIRSDAPNKGDSNWTVNRNVWTGLGVLRVTRDGLRANTRYDVQVRAVNNAGEGPWSATSSGATTAMLTPPGAPGGLTATGNGQTLIDLSWSAPASNGGSRITGYRMEVSTNRSSWSDLVSNTGSSATRYTHTGLTAGSTRHYRVSAINSAGTGSPSNVAEASTDIASAPDLVVDSPTVSESAPEAGARFTLSATVHNQGNGASVSTTLRYYQSTGSVITTGDREVDTDSVFRLDSLETVDESVTLTAPDTPGTYYYGACVDSVSDESDTTNNCSVAVAVTVGAAPAPDLVVDRPTVSESAPDAEESFTLSATVRNQGNAISASSTLRYYQSTDSTITSGDTQMSTDFVSRLDAAESAGESVALTAPDKPGTYYYGACVDSVSDESDTTNNCSAAVAVTVGAAPAPDLVVDRPTVSESAPDAEESFTLSATVRNQGNAISASSTLRYYQSTDSTITASDAEVDTDSVFRLDASDTGDESVRVTAPETPGTYYYGACVDSVSDESDAANNCSAAVAVTVGAAPAPDLVVDRPTVSESAPDAEESFTLSATVRNQGNGISASSTLRYYQSTDSAITTGDTEVGTDAVFRLDASETGDESASLTAPDTPGTYYYGACVDAVSDESDTVNNCSAAVAVMVGAAPAPDLVVDRPTVSESAPDAEERFTLSATVHNQGNGSSSFTTLRYYQSADSTITTGDTEVGTDSVLSLDASESGDENVSLDAPSTPGTYYYGACIDSESDESDTANNCSVAVAVTVAAALVAPSNQRYIWQGSATVVSWDPVPNAGYYKVYYHDFFGSSCRLSGGSPSFCEEVAGNVSGTSYTHADPDNDRNYYWIAACNDAGCSAIDSGNPAQREGAAPAPDLIVDTPAVSESAPEAGARFTLNATVRNQGNAASASTTLRYYRSTDSTITAADTELGTDSVSRLDASATGDESISLTAPSTEGTYYYGACVDSVSDESTTTNNCSSAVTVTVGAAPAPNLVVDAPTVSTSAPTAGASFTLNATVRNQGNGRSDSTTLRYYRSTDSTITTADTGGGTDSVSSLNPSASGAESISLTAPDTPGTYYYGACVDAVSDETDTANNCSVAVSITVGEASVPDLVVSTFTVGNSSPTPGQYFVLNATVYNQGNGPSSSTTLRYYRSTDATITTSDAIISTGGTPGYLSVDGLSASGSIDKSASTKAPSALGTYYFGACVETVTRESDTTNNCSPSATITIQRTNQPPRLTGDVDDKIVELGDSFTVDLSGLFTDPDGDDITSYGFTYRTRGILTGTVHTKTGILSLRAIAVGETIVAVDARDSNGASGASEDLFKVTVTEAETPGKPGAPTGLTATADGQTEIDLSWRAPSDDGGANITGYRIEVSTNGPNWSDLESNTRSTSTSYSHTGLTAGSTRHYRVSAINSAGTGPESNVDDATTESAPVATEPGAPTGLTATADGQTEIDLSWRAPSDDGGANITGYRIEVSTNGSNWSDLESNTRSTSTSYSHTGLTAGSTRHYRVSAINSAGTGPESNVDDATTESAPVATEPGAPTGLTATADGQTEIDLSWRAPSDDGGANITGYRIEVSNNGSNWSDLESNTRSTRTSYSHTGLTAGSTRHYRVSAINSEGTGAASNVDDATTDSAPDPDPTPVPRPTTDAVSGEITDCSGEQLTPGVDTYSITVTGTVAASRDVENVIVTGNFNGEVFGVDNVGDLAEGETASFSISGYVSRSSGSCGVEITWLEIS